MCMHAWFCCVGRWSTHWFQLEMEIPETWIGEEVQLVWDSESEALVWKDGVPLQVTVLLTIIAPRSFINLCNTKPPSGRNATLTSSLKLERQTVSPEFNHNISVALILVIFFFLPLYFSIALISL